MKCCCILLIFFPLVLFAQKSPVFKIDSLTTEGVLLNKNWKWHAGDNPEWANLDFDDSVWESVNPTLNHVKIPQVRAAEISWFRIPINIDSALVNLPLIASLDVCGAVEVYFNGKLLNHIGTVSKDPSVEVAYYANFLSLSTIMFPRKDKNVIAVRYSLTRGNIYWASFRLAQGNPFNLRIRQLARLNEQQLANYDREVMRFIPFLGINLTLAFIHFAFFYFFPKEKANLWFGCAMLLHAFQLWLRYEQIDTVTVSFNTIDQFIRQPVILAYNTFIILAIHNYLRQPLKKTFWVAPLWFIVFYTLLFFNYGKQMYVLFLFSFPLGTLYYLTIVRKSIREGNNEGKIILYMGWFSLISQLIFTMTYVFDLFNMGGFTKNMLLFKTVCLNLNFLSVTVGMSLTLARDFAYTSRSLQLKSKEVQQLSTEKQRIAADMHDDIGSDLSALNLKAEMIRQKVKAGKQPLSEIDNLVDFTRDIAKKVREVIWTVNARHDSLLSIINYFDTYSDDFFEPTNINVQTRLPPNIPQTDINGESRKVLLMCFKETLNNVLKHAKASNLKIAFAVDNHALTISIQDNGVGFDPSVLMASATTHGDGLLNMPARMASIGGQCSIQTSPQGTLVVFSLPI